MNGNTEAVSARQIDPIYASPLASTWGTLIVQIGGYARASYGGGGGGTSRVPRIPGDVSRPALVSCVLVSYGPCAESPAFDLLWRGWPPGTALWGFNSGFMGVQLGGKVIWAGLEGCGCGAGLASNSGRLSLCFPDD